jgi:CheY-like chemotaxis protein
MLLDVMMPQMNGFEVCRQIGRTPFWLTCSINGDGAG